MSGPAAGPDARPIHDLDGWPDEPPDEPTGERRRGLLRNTRALWPQALKPRLGQPGGQYRPRRLMVPRAYLAAEPPQPAPKISIVTPLRDSAAFIERTLLSVLGQEYPALELIVKDGGSSDGGDQIARSFGSGLTLLEGPDRGPANGINQGFAKTSGELMAWLNSDDLLLPGSLSYVAEYFRRHPEVDLVYGHRIILDDADNDIGLWVTPEHCEDTLQWFDYLPQETAFWRRSLWDRLGGLDESFEVAYDWELFSRFQLGDATLVRLPRFLGAYRYHPLQRTERLWTVASAELDRIRNRRHARPVSVDEAKSRVDRFRFRSVPGYLHERAAFRFGRRSAVSVFGGEALRDPRNP